MSKNACGQIRFPQSGVSSPTSSENSPNSAACAMPYRPATEHARCDEVIVPTLTYVATANVVRYCGGRPVLVDVDRTTFNIDPAAIEAKVGPRTRGIIAVHLYGHPAEMDQVRRIAQRHQLFVVEDASEAHGAEYRGARVGGLGGCAAFPFTAIRS
jgi:dTDP-4-amino-4,6-dideoxygalactose transaminase